MSYENDIAEICEAIKFYDYDKLTENECFEKILSYKSKDAVCGEKLEQAFFSRAKELHRQRDFKKLFDIYKRVKAQSATVIKGNRTQFSDQPIELNCGQWICDDKGIRIVRILPSGETKTEVASYTPILITEIMKNVERAADNEKVRLSYCDNGMWKSMVCDNGMLCESKRITGLSGVGIDVTSNTAKLLVDYIRDIKNGNRDIIPVRASIDRLGWVKDKEFAPYGELSFDGESNYRSLFEAVTQKGDYEEWKSRMSELRKNIYFRLMMDASLASPLLSRLDALPFMLHLWGGTGSGKTVGLACAMSVWGDPRAGKLWRSMNNTGNAVMRIASVLHHLPTGLDELQVIKSKESYDSLIMKLTEGIDRGRMSGQTLLETSTWCSSFITTGEEPIVKGNSGGGAVNRVIELDCTNRSVIDGKGNEIIAFVNENYGFAGREFIEFARDFKLIREMYNQCLSEILETCDTTEKQACSMAVILLADFIATSCIFTEELPLSVENIGQFLVTKSQVDVSERAYDYVSGMVSLNAARFKAGGFDDMWGKFDGTDAVYIHKEILNTWLEEKGFDFKAIKKRWAQLGYLILNSRGKYVHQTSCNGVMGNYVKLTLRADWEDIS